MNCRLFIILSFLLLCFSCTEQTTIPELEKEKPNRIVLIFKEPVENGFFKDPETGKRSFGRTDKGDEIQIIDDHYVESRLSFEIGAASDTVVINTEREVMEVRLMYKGVDDLNYIFENGDSVEFSYEGIKPIARVLNRDEDPTVTNYSLYIRDSIAIADFMAIERFRNPLLRLDGLEASGLTMDAFFQKVQKEAVRDVAIEYASIYDLLDILLAHGRLTQAQYEYRLQNLYNDILTSELSTRIYGQGENKFQLSKAQEVIEGFKKRFSQTNHSRKDSLLFTSSYRKYLGTSVAAELKGKIEWKSREGRGSGARTLNHLQRYDSIRAIEYMSPLEKKVIQYYTVDNMFSQPGFFSIKDRLKYLNRFKNDFEDSAMVQSLISKYNVEFKIEDDIMLESNSGEKLSMQQLVAQYEGNLIYVDFWAGWCGPCIQEMPHSKRLQEDLAGQPIVYVYISSDRTEVAWKKSMDKHELKQGLHYRITNASTSQGLEDLSIMFIPRYMIFDKQGNIVNKDAPRPSEPDLLKTEFARYL